jgi:hypothetical protein
MDKITTRTTNGQTVEVKFEDWVEGLIDKSITRHKDSCPATALDKRLAVVELHLKVIIASLIPVYLWGLGYILNQVGKLLGA